MRAITEELINTLVAYREAYADIPELEEVIISDSADIRRIIAQFAVNEDLQELYEEIRYLDTLVREYFESTLNLIELKLAEIA